MPLPDANTSWPPKRLTVVRSTITEWKAWYVGTPDALRSAYGASSGNGGVSTIRPSQMSGGVVGAAARFWWGRPQTDANAGQRDHLHIPVAADLCQAAADLVFAEPPNITHETPATTERVAALVDDHLLTKLREGAEVAAAMAGVFLTISWDKNAVADRPFIRVIRLDHAAPEFVDDRLRAVTFWWKVREDGQLVWRHLERHEIDPATGNGIIVHGLYKGTFDNLGQPVPLEEDPSTEGLARVVDARSAIDTGSAGLSAVYVPSLRPARRWMDDDLGSQLGRSVLDGVEGLMDALDETYSSWMRDIRLGKARVIVAQSMLDSNGPGKGATFDLDRELFTEVNALPSRDASGLPIEKVQFDIRVADHQATAQDLYQRILRTAGFSSQTFGETTDTAATATEVTARERRSFMTRDSMIRHWRPAVADLMNKLLAVDNYVFKSGNDLGSPVQVDFPDGVQESPSSLAGTVQLLTQAQAASTRVKVQMVHPDWNDTQVDEEVARIQAEQGMAVPDPTVLP